MIQWNKYEIWKKKSLNLKRNLLKELVQFFDFSHVKITQKRQKNKTNSLNKFRLRSIWSGRIVLLNAAGEERRGEQCMMWSEHEIKCRRQSIISTVGVGSKSKFSTKVFYCRIFHHRKIFDRHWKQRQFWLT